MIDKLLKKIGFIRVSNIEKEYLQLVDSSLFNDKFDSTKFEDMKAKLRGNKEFIEYCDWTIIQDIKRHFNASPEEQPIIRGAVSRTRYFRSLCTDAQEKKLPIQRYI